METMVIGDTFASDRLDTISPTSGNNGKTMEKKKEEVHRVIREEIARLYERHSGQLHLRDVLKEICAGSVPLECAFNIQGDKATLAWETFSCEVPVLKEERTGKQFVIAQIPSCCLTVDERVNPRNLQIARMERLVEAFRGGQTRFQVTQCRLLKSGDHIAVAVFDGSHGTAAEVLARSRTITCKIYLPGELSDAEAFEWNTEAHSSLRQQEFRSRVLMGRRAQVFDTEFGAFLRDPRFGEVPQSESGFISTLPAYQRRSMIDSIRDYVYSAVLEDEHEVEFLDPTTGEIRTRLEPSCKLQAFVRKDEQQYRGGKFLGYDLLKGTILKDFVQQDASEKVVTRMAREEMPREQERRNLTRLCNIITEEILEGRWGKTQEVGDPSQENAAPKKKRKQKVPAPEAIISENIWKKGAVRVWSKRLRDAIGLMLMLASSDLESVFQRSIDEETWVMIRAAVRKIYTYGAWSSGDRVVPLLGGNVIGEIERALDEWAELNGQPRLHAYYLAGRERP